MLAWVLLALRCPIVAHLAADTLSLLLNGYDLTQSGGETDEGDAQTTTCFEPRNGNRGIDLVQVCLVC